MKTISTKDDYKNLKRIYFARYRWSRIIGHKLTSIFLGLFSYSALHVAQQDRYLSLPNGGFRYAHEIGWIDILLFGWLSIVSGGVAFLTFLLGFFLLASRSASLRSYEDFRMKNRSKRRENSKAVKQHSDQTQ